MGQPIEVRVDVKARAALGPMQIAATLHLPDPRILPERPILFFAVPGGGYNRRYFDAQFEGLSGYSEAAHHIARGAIVVALDHIGVGDSTVPEDPSAITPQDVAESYDSAVKQLTARFKAGAIDPDFPALKNFCRIGLGQSMGGCFTIVTQALKGTFDAIGVLGFSAVRTWLPRPPGQSEKGPTIDFVYPFYLEDVPRQIIESDMAGGYPMRKTAPAFGSLSVPMCVVPLVAEGAMAPYAREIAVPVLLAMGERDVCRAPHSEVAAYSKSQDVSLFIAPGMAHMHNFGTTRKAFWDRIMAWSTMIAAR